MVNLSSISKRCQELLSGKDAEIAAQCLKDRDFDRLSDLIGLAAEDTFKEVLEQLSVGLSNGAEETIGNPVTESKYMALQSLGTDLFEYMHFNSYGM